MEYLSIPAAARSKVSIYDRSLAGIAGSNPTGVLEVCLFWMLCVVRQRCLRRADYSSRGVLPNVVCLNKCGSVVSIMRRPWPTGWLLRLGKKWVWYLPDIQDMSIGLKGKCKILLGKYPSQVTSVKTISWLTFMGLGLLKWKSTGLLGENFAALCIWQLNTNVFSKAKFCLGKESRTGFLTPHLVKLLA